MTMTNEERIAEMQESAMRRQSEALTRIQIENMERQRLKALYRDDVERRKVALDMAWKCRNGGERVGDIVAAAEHYDAFLRGEKTNG
jgi:hypothetical protein